MFLAICSLELTVRTAGGDTKLDHVSAPYGQKTAIVESIVNSESDLFFDVNCRIRATRTFYRPILTFQH